MEMLMHFLLGYLCLTIVVVFSLVLLNIIHNYGSDKFSSIFSRNIPAKPESGDSVIAAGIN